MSGYPGSKGASGSSEKIIGCFPRHTLYVEPFVGKSAVLRRKKPVRSVVFDVAAGLSEYWRDFGHVSFIPKCGVAFLQRVYLPPDALVYCDPPYPHETRSKRRLYVEEWSRERHAEFLMAVVRLGCFVVVSTYPNAQYAAALSDWRYFDYQAMTRGGPRTERVYCNFGEGVASGELYGSDYRERWRLKKKARRWVTRFSALPPGERQAVISELVAAGIIEVGAARGASVPALQAFHHR